MLFLVVSDFHLGGGEFLSNGQRNSLEDFFEDHRFQEFLAHYSTGDYLEEEVHLVLNGDILNLIQPIEGQEATHEICEERTIESLILIAKGHPVFFDSLSKFLKVKNKKCSYIIGNHDSGMDFPGVKDKFRELVNCKDVQIEEFLRVNGVHFEHGHRFEAINTVPKGKYYLEKDGKKVLNLPWGSLFCIFVLPELKNRRPHIDKVRPVSSYIKWCFFHDTMFFFWMLYKVIFYIFKTRLNSFLRQNSNFKTTIKILKQVTVYPKYESKAKRILKKGHASGIHTVVMGHTHVPEWRKYKTGQVYLNCGTWNPIPSIDFGQHESSFRLTYAAIKVDKEKNSLINAYLNEWQGYWRPLREVISLNNLS